MRYSFYILFIFLMVLSGTVYAAADSYEILDGPTAPEAAATVAANAPAPAPATAAQINEDNDVVYDIISRKPPCTNSTCITPQTIANANHAFVNDSPVKSYVSLISAPDGEEQECQAPVQTGMTVYKQVVEEGNGKIIQVNDAFCINQGCVYFGGLGNEKCQ